MHVDKLEFGWWYKKNELPTTVGEKRNFVLNTEELAKYVEIMERFAQLAVREHANARLLVRTLERRHVPPFETPPQLVTIASTLEACVKEAKVRLELLNLLSDVAKRAVATIKEGDHA